MDNSYNTINVDCAAQVPTLPPNARNPHLVINFPLPATTAVISNQGYPANQINVVAKHHSARDHTHSHLLANLARTTESES